MPEKTRGTAEHGSKPRRHCLETFAPTRRHACDSSEYAGAVMDSVATTRLDSGRGDASPEGPVGTAHGASASYAVHTPVFEGPFDLLLHLILRQEVDLWQVHLSSIVDAYLAEMDRLERVDLETATEFLLIAATLVDLKARRLLPGRDRTELDDELARFEERDLLLARLLDCKTFQDAAAAISERLDGHRGRWPRTAGPEEPFASLAPDALECVSSEDIRAAAIRALAPRPEPAVQTEHLAPIRASVRDAIETVLTLLPESGFVSFVDLARGSQDRLEVVVRFLAVLELCKQGAVDLEQVGTFSDLMVRVAGTGHVDVDLAAAEWDEEGNESEHRPSSEDGAGDDLEASEAGLTPAVPSGMP